MARDSNRPNYWNFESIKSIENTNTFHGMVDEMATGMELESGGSRTMHCTLRYRPSDVPDAVEYLNSVKTEFAHDPAAYRRFLDLMRDWYHVDWHVVDSRSAQLTPVARQCA
jgi:histone deacetylase complex regulatory component SIN3